MKTPTSIGDDGHQHRRLFVLGAIAGSLIAPIIGCTIWRALTKPSIPEQHSITEPTQSNALDEHAASTSVEKTEHNRILHALAKKMEMDGWTLVNSSNRHIADNPMVFLGMAAVSPSDPKFRPYIKLSLQTDQRDSGYIWFVVHYGERLGFRQIDELYRIASNLLSDFPADEWRLMDEMLRAAERIYQRDVKNSKEPELRGEFRVTEHRTTTSKGNRLGEPDLWRYDVSLDGESDKYRIKVRLIDELYENPRAVAEVKLVPK